ncbi:hypothetical protein AKJ16_DCAP13848, partial [Drosera capensis]
SSDKFSIRSSLLHGSGDGFLLESGSEFSEFEDDELTEELADLEEGYASDDGQIPEGQKGSQTGDASSNLEPDVQLDSAEVEVNTNNPSDSGSEESNALETLWEHQELVDQLKMEARKVRAIGLPTIFEDSDSSKIAMSDLKPWKIEDKIQKNQYHGTILEIHKFYKSYRERMRKFDIFNYQKTYTIDFLGLKNPLERFSIGRRSAGSLAAIMWQDFWPCMLKVSEQPSPVTKFSKELDCDLEMVYVGQLCLSWEFLHWEYGKALELWDSDPHGFLQYNKVAGEFQQFQVLLQRFVEDEPFKGPRVQNYAKTRRHQQHLLQVPVIRAVSKAVTYIIMQSYVFFLEPLNSEVSTALRLSLSGYKLPRQYLYDEEPYVLIFIAEDRGKGRKTVTGKGGVTSSMLVEIMEESMRIFWKFICADKYAHGIISKCRRGSNVQSSDAIDAQFLMEVQDCARKRRKILAELSRHQKGIWKIFRKHEEGEDRVLYFFCQVDLRLVSRVLNMLKITTDQLIWCSNKLNKTSKKHKGTSKSHKAKEQFHKGKKDGKSGDKPLRCFLCMGLHLAHDCPKKNGLSVMIAEREEDSRQPKEQTLGKESKVLVDTGATHNFLESKETDRLGIKYKKEDGWLKTKNSSPKKIHGVSWNVKVSLGMWTGLLDFYVVPMDEYAIVLSMKFMDKTKMVPLPYGNTMCIYEGGELAIVPLI